MFIDYSSRNKWLCWNLFYAQIVIKSNKWLRTETWRDSTGRSDKKIRCSGWHAPDAVTSIQTLNGLGVMWDTPERTSTECHSVIQPIPLSRFVANFSLSLSLYLSNFIYISFSIKYWEWSVNAFHARALSLSEIGNRKTSRKRKKTKSLIRNINLSSRFHLSLFL